MAWQYSSYSLLLFVAATVACVWALYAVSYIRTHGRKQYHTVFVILCIGTAIWSVAYAVQLTATDLATKRLAYNILHLGVGTVVTSWFVFALSYTGRSQWLTPPIIGLLSLIPAGLAIGVWVNPSSIALTSVALETSDGFVMLVTGNGPLYQLFLAYTYTLIPLGAIIVFRHALSAATQLKRQSLLVAVGALIPLVVNVFHVLGIPPVGAVRVNLTPVSVSAAAVLFGIALFRYQLLAIAPIARKAVFENIQEGVVVLNEREEIVDINPQARNVIHPTAQPIGVPIREVLPAYDDLTAVDSQTTTRLSIDGDDRHFRLTRSQLTQNGTAYGWVVLLSDITTREQQRQELNRQNDRLSAFAKTVSHDLRNPLAIISGHLELARETGEKTHFETADRTVKRMDTFLNELLTLSQAGESIGERVPVSLATVLNEVLDPQNQPLLTVRLETDAVVLADRMRLKQLLDNLLRNAVDHATTPTQPPRSSVAAGSDPVDMHDETGVTVTVGRLSTGFYIADDGPGIPPDMRDSVFEYGTTTHRDGTGFGLGIVHDIIVGHGWEITVTESAAGGARFEITGVDFPDTEPSALSAG